MMPSGQPELPPAADAVLPSVHLFDDKKVIKAFGKSDGNSRCGLGEIPIKTKFFLQFAHSGSLGRFAAGDSTANADIPIAGPSRCIVLPPLDQHFSAHVEYANVDHAAIPSGGNRISPNDGFACGDPAVVVKVNDFHMYLTLAQSLETGCLERSAFLGHPQSANQTDLTVPAAPSGHRWKPEM